MGKSNTAPLMAKGPMRQTFWAMRLETRRMTTKAVVRASRYLKREARAGMSVGWTLATILEPLRLVATGYEWGASHHTTVRRQDRRRWAALTPGAGYW